MKNSESDQAFFIESDEDDDKDSIRGEDDGNESEFSNYSDDNPHHQSKPSSLNPSWPQSYRQSIDLYSSVPSPSLNFLGTPTLSRLGSSFLSSSLTRRHTPEILPSLSKPFLPPATDNQQPQERRSSHSLLPPRGSSAKKLPPYQKSSKVSHELPLARQSSYGQSVVNGINVLCGVGILSTPYAVKEGGWVGLLLLFLFGVLSFYTGILLRYCLDSQPGLETYPDIGQAAFGTTGRLIISIILYVELYACCVEYIILESDNLSSLFPNAHLNLGGLILNAHYLFAIMMALAVLPTVWLRDMSVLSYISAGGVVASVLAAGCLFWVGLVDNVGFQIETTKALNLSSFPVAIGLYGYCYSGHAVFPNIYTSMAKRSQYPMVLLTSFCICGVLYAGVAVMGYMMFGESTASQFTLNLPTNLVASKLAVWTTVVNPFTKYALTISPVAMSLEELIPSNHMKSHIYSILIRTGLVLSTLLVALCIPFFGLVMSLIGSLMTMLVTLILPCLCFLSIRKGKITLFQVSLCVLIIAVGSVSLGIGTYTSLAAIIQQLS
ncbi:putative amino acid transporter, transmembrane domain-containing protein [Helianthus annuus]|nr:amino acid transporter AVT1C [Helianthus annuus]KAJ0465553.1 putative amino acid transporter, transmembrane domain-containing protein [Helianthus annuus]KAJ0470402.1 putative amino acid transporter, transmembrane domain-containing protein [Helianthus annuus]KAJ0487146.1 putative amino acid transporter, transmembrane domain-containing protein [Helianthus annuus]KAJ0855420.1 putative amino acid transporter, transmembrane domain-containing protein [Helianthus annuus]